MCAAKIETIHLGKGFYQERLDRYTSVLDHLNLAVASGEFVSLVGPSGCGKTTLLNLLDGLAFPTEGQVLVDGAAVLGPGPDRALVFQEPALLPWRTVLGNIAYGLECLKADRRETAIRAQAWLQAVGLEGFGTHYPHELSGGMQQRANLARALAV